MNWKDRQEKLQLERAVLREYLIAKYQAEDWHGVQDAASDLRDIDSELKVIEVVLKEQTQLLSMAGKASER